MSDKEPATDKKEAMADLSAMLGMGGFLDGVSNLISKFGELAERGESLQKTMGESPSGKPIQGSMGFKVRFGGAAAASNSDFGAGDAPAVSPVNTERTTARSSRAANAPKVLKTRQPQVDVFEEADHLLVVAEMPGVEPPAVQLTLADCRLHLAGTSQTAEFKVDLELPRRYTADQVEVTGHNGVIEVRLNHDVGDSTN